MAPLTKTFWFSKSNQGPRNRIANSVSSLNSQRIVSVSVWTSKLYLEVAATVPENEIDSCSIDFVEGPPIDEELVGEDFVDEDSARASIAAAAALVSIEIACWPEAIAGIITTAKTHHNKHNKPLPKAIRLDLT